MIAEVAFHAVIAHFPKLQRMPEHEERAPGFERRMFSKLVVKPD